MKTEVKKVTPSIASDMLKRNINNRRFSESNVDFLSSQMSNGNWLFDGQPIRFSNNGGLLDGQHRLRAIIKSSTTQEFLIVTGIPEESFKVMDTGKNRSGADCFHINGIEYASDVSASCKLIVNLNRKQRSDSGHNKISNLDLLDWYRDNPSLLGMVKESDILTKAFSRVLSRSAIAAWKFMFSEKSVTESELFMSKLCTGLDLDMLSPIYILRKKLVDDKMSKSSLPVREKSALIIKAWNLHRKGVDCKRLIWNKETEPFPSIL